MKFTAKKLLAMGAVLLLGAVVEAIEFCIMKNDIKELVAEECASKKN